MTPGKIVELIMKDGDRAIGYYQYRLKGGIVISTFSNGMTSFTVSHKDIKKIEMYGDSK